MRRLVRGCAALAAVLTMTACAGQESQQVLLPLDAIQPGAGPIALGEGFDDAPRAIKSAVIAGDLLVGGQAASRMTQPSAIEPAAGAASEEPVVVTGIEDETEAAIAVRRQAAFEQMTAGQREARLRQANQDLLLEQWMRTRVSPAPMSRAEVRRAQELLAELGFDPGPIDGLVGPRTRTAVQGFEAAQGLPVSGEVTPALIDRMALEI
jgi:hypothetical protein